MENFKLKLHDILTNDRRKLYKFIVLIILIGVSISLNVYQNNRTEIQAESNLESSIESVEESNIIGYVDISGEVKQPGVYEIDNNTRLYELVEKAGGVTDNANLDLINQAEIVVDGSKIIIPSILSDVNNEVHDASQNSSNGLININNADLEELKKLDGVGDSIAQRIIDYRATTRFNSIEDIKNIRGIGDVTYQKIKSQIIV